MTQRRLAAAQVFVDDIGNPVLDGADAHHVIRVLRVRPGEVVAVSDGRGSWRMCVMSSRHELEPVDDMIHSESRAGRPIGVAFGVTKSDKPETVVQKLTELGVDHIAPVLLEHSVVRWDEDKIDRQHERFLRVVREAAMQSRQVFLPTVHRVAVDLPELLRNSTFTELKGSVAAAEPGGEDRIESVSVIVVGPEGGFSQEELSCFDKRVSLPGGILRAETAAIAAGVLLAHSRELG